MKEIRRFDAVSESGVSVTIIELQEYKDGIPGLKHFMTLGGSFVNENTDGTYTVFNHPDSFDTELVVTPNQAN